MKKAQVTAEKTAWLEVITHAQSHLGSAKIRARYDRTLAQEAEESFESLAEFALKGLGRLDPGTQSALIEEAAALGIASERADRLIGRICRRLGVTRDRGAAAARCFAAGLRPPPRSRGPCQRLSQVQPAALPALRGRDRDEPGGTQGRLGAVPALRGVAEMGLPGLPSATSGSTSADAPAGSDRHFASRWCGISRRPRTRFATSTWRRALEHLDRVQEFAPNLAGARNGVAKIRQRQADIARVQLAYQTARAGGRLVIRPRGDRGLEPAGRPGIARPSGGLVRAVPGLAPRRGAGGPSAEPRADRPAGRASPLSPEPGHRRRPARGPGRA